MCTRQWQHIRHIDLQMFNDTCKQCWNIGATHESSKGADHWITGQDGSYLAELLLSKGYEVHGMVRRVASKIPPAGWDDSPR